MTVHHYDVHRLVGLDVASSDPVALDFFDREYGFFLRPTPGDGPRVSLSWERGRAAAEPLLRRHSHKVFARWRYRMSLRPQAVDLVARGNRLAIPMVHHMMVHPALRVLASRDGAILLHASSVALDGRSLILTGTGGVGKTTTSSLLLAYGDRGWSPHADDYVLLRADGTSLAYPTRAHLYQNLLTWVPSLAARLTALERVRLRFFWWMRTALGVKWPVRVEAERLWPGRSVTAQAQVAAIVVLQRGPSETPRLQPMASGSLPVDDLVAVNFREASRFLELVRAAGDVAEGQSWIEDWTARETKVMRALAQRVPAYTLEIPWRSPDAGEAGRSLAAALQSLMSRGAS